MLLFVKIARYRTVPAAANLLSVESSLVTKLEKPHDFGRMKTDLLVLLPEEIIATKPPGRRLSICLINPRFEPSYWGFDFALPLYPGDKRSTMISGSLTAVAGLCGDHDVDLLDENVEEIDWESLRQYDIVGVTGMNVQKNAHPRRSCSSCARWKSSRSWAGRSSRCKKSSSTGCAT